MGSAEDQLKDMLKELKSRSMVQVALESGLYALILLLLFVGNSATLAVVAVNPRMRTIPNMFVTSLAITDLLLGALSTCPIGLTTLVISQWPFKGTSCQYQGYIVVTLAVASMQTLALMAVNRYFRIVSPAKYRRYFTKTKTRVMILMSWIWSAWAPLPYLLSGHKMVFHPSKFFCYLQIDSGPFTAFMVTINIGLPTSVIVYCYVKIHQTVRTHNNDFRVTGTRSNTINVEEIKVARTLFVIVVFFMLCWTPILLIDVVDTIYGSWIFPREVYVAYSYLGTISSALNPFIYGVFNKNFQKEYLKMLRCSCCHFHRATVEPFILVEKKACGKQYRSQLNRCKNQ